MMPRWWPLWSSPLLLVVAAIHAAAGGDMPQALSSEAAAHAKVCVTRHGLCRTPMMRAGDPCSCPHPWRGGVPGHVERMDAAAPELPRSGHRPDTEPGTDPMAGTR